jgi:hypothetical protein
MTGNIQKEGPSRASAAAGVKKPGSSNSTGLFSGNQDGRLPANSTATSRLAAESMQAAAPGQRRRVLQAIVDSGIAGFTAEQVADVLNLRIQSATARIHELRGAGHIFVSGRRATTSGRLAGVYCITPAGLHAAEGGER